MKIKLAIAACALSCTGFVMAADQPEIPANAPAAVEQPGGFGRGDGMGTGGTIGSSSMGNGFGAPAGNSTGGQGFGVGFTPQQAAGFGFTLPTNPLTNANGGNAGKGALGP